jgi:hypothetical protein
MGIVGYDREAERPGFPIYTVDPKGFDGVIRTIRNMGETSGKGRGKSSGSRMMEKKEKVVTLT